MSTEAWQGYKQKTFPEKGWQVKDGLLMVGRSGTEEGFGGDIITKEQYENFQFKTDFRLSTEGNSGIVYLVKKVEGCLPGIMPQSISCWIMNIMKKMVIFLWINTVPETIMIYRHRL